jgi:hypothetical protein
MVRKTAKRNLFGQTVAVSQVDGTSGRNFICLRTGSMLLRVCEGKRS